MKRFYLLASVLVVAGLLSALISNITDVTAQDGDDPPDGEFTWAGEIEAPDFPDDADWINTSGPISFADLRGKIVLLDFWTYGCINCIHIIPQLKQLEAEYDEELVVIGVHSAKFDNEGETENIRRIVRRYEIEHPVINDNQFVTWRQYGVRAWPTLMIIDPYGRVVGQLSGEPIYDRVQPVIDTMAREYGAAGVINTEPLPQWQPEMTSDEDNTALRFPGKVLADPDGNRLFVADSNHNRIVVSTLDTFEVLHVIGDGEIGLEDGDFATARFFRPQGMTLVEDVLFVADTENHAIRAVSLITGMVTTVAGTGEQGFNRLESGPGLEMALNSPWDLVAHEGTIYIAMAGPHQLWFYDCDTGQVGPYAGSGREALEDGKLLSGALNQPSGIDTDGKLLYFADAEASAVRTADLDPNGELKTIVGTGLFDFGDVDGVGDDVRLQHVLGITVADDGYLYVADTYNNKIKRIDPEARESVTFAGTGVGGLADGTEAQFYEPGGLDYADGKLYVADTNNHAIRVIDVASGAVSTVEFANVALLTGDELADASEPATSDLPNTGGLFGVDSVTLAPQTVAPGEGQLLINVTMPEGYKLNTQAPFTAIWPEDAVVQIPAESRDIRIVFPELPIRVPVTFAEGQTELAVNLTVYWCEAVNETLCFVDRVELTVPLTVVASSDQHDVMFEHGLVPPTIENTFYPPSP